MSNDNPNMIPQRAIIDEPMYDSETGEYGKGYSPDNGKTRIIQEGVDGRHYHQDTDAGRISELVFDSFKLKSPDGTVWIVSIDNEGNLSKEKEES
ncbi:hypothetical protein [Limosilactobacillus pontis]|uniref:hypothetical protein n=1 Tax=Limosilactobacillus pontis TaxID=35787 RepID=UPI00241EBE8C|nr:hypothetical protein [Limosilactobacillus pontis]